MFTLTSRCVVDVLCAFGSASSPNRTNRRRGRREMLDICNDDDQTTTTTQTQTHTQTRYNTKQCKNRREALMALAFLSSSSLFSSPFSVFLSSSYAFEEEIGKEGDLFRPQNIDISDEFKEISQWGDPPVFLRKTLEIALAVALLRSSYDAIDELNICAMATEHRYQRRVQRDFAMGRPSGFLAKNFRNSISRCFIEIIVRCHR